MKRKIFLFAALLVIPFLVFSCGESSRDDERFGETDMPGEEEAMGEENTFWTSDRDYAFEEKDQFKQDVDEALVKLDGEIQTMEQNASEATSKTKQWYNEQIANLKTHRDHINNKLAEFANVTEENWEDFKGEIVSAWDDIENSWDQMAREIEEDKDKQY